MSRTKTPISKYVMQIAEAHPEGFTPADVREIVPKSRAKQISTVLFQMRKKGILHRGVDTGVYTLTPVNTSVAKAEPTQNKPVSTREVEAELMLRNQELFHKLEDALAIIRYLEDKVFKAIQFNAQQHGSNT